MSSHVSQFEWFKRLPMLAVASCVFTLWGCALFIPSDSSTALTTRRLMLPPIQATPDSIQLEVFFLERPADDHLISTTVWKEVDQIGAVPAETREILSSNGFRVGQVSSNLPQSVQKLLGMSAEIPASESEYARPIMGRHQFLAPGVETEIPTGIQHEKCEFQVRDGSRSKKLEFEQVSCVLRMKAQRLQDGWVRVDFQPEIHHGDKQMRPTPSNDGWTFRGGQNIDVRHAQRFSVSMNVGELVLITSTSDDEGTLGDRFFCHEERGLKKQRVLIVRIVDSGQQAQPSSK